jgi:hypothetical protein
MSLKTGRLEEGLRKNREEAKTNGSQVLLPSNKAAITPHLGIHNPDMQC